MGTIGLLAYGWALGLLHAFVLWKHWQWFAMPLGAQWLSYWHFCGLLGAAALFRLLLALDLPALERPDAVLKAFAKGILSVMSLGSGWVYVTMMGLN